MKLIENINIEKALAPVDIDNTATDGVAVSLAEAKKVVVLIECGDLHASASCAVTLEQATTQAFGTNKAVSFSTYYTKATGGGAWTENTATDNTFNITGAAFDNTLVAIEVDADALDQENAYEYFRVAFASPGNYSCILSAQYLLHGLRYTGAGSAQTDATA